MTAKRPFVPEDIIRLKSAVDFTVSPGGEVVVATESLDLQGNRRETRLHRLVDGKCVPLACEGTRNDGAAFAPNGRDLAFVSNREAGEQVWLMQRDGTFKQLTRFAGYEVRRLRWSPDGTRLAVEVRTASKLEPDAPRVITGLREFLNGTGYIGGTVYQVLIIDVHDGHELFVSDPAWHHFAPSFSPDGNTVALCTTRRENWDCTWVWDVARVELGSGDLELLTPSDAVCMEPAYSPDGEWIAFYRNGVDFTGSTVDYHLTVVPAAGGALTDLGATLDRGAAVWQPPSLAEPPRWQGSGSILWPVRFGGSVDVVRTTLEGESKRLTHLDGQVLSLVQAGERLLGLVATWDRPSEIAELYRDGRLDRISDLNPFLEGVQLSQPASYQLTAADGHSVECWLWRGSDKSAATLVQMHGGPHGAVGSAFSALHQVLCGAGFHVVSVNFRGSAGYGQAFSDLIHGDWGPREGEDAVMTARDLVGRGIADPDRLGVYGISYGGFMTNWCLTHSDCFHAGVTMAPISHLATIAYGIDQWESIATDQGGSPAEMPDYYRQHSPISHVTNITAPLLILQGEDDKTCPIGEGEMLYVALRWLGREAAFVRYPGEAHGFLRGRPRTRLDAAQRIRDWFQDHLLDR